MKVRRTMFYGKQKRADINIVTACVSGFYTLFALLSNSIVKMQQNMMAHSPAPADFEILLSSLHSIWQKYMPALLIIGFSLFILSLASLKMRNRGISNIFLAGRCFLATALLFWLIHYLPEIDDYNKIFQETVNKLTPNQMFRGMQIMSLYGYIVVAFIFSIPFLIHSIYLFEKFKASQSGANSER